MRETIIGYARCSTDEQDRTAQRQHLAELRVADERVYLDHGRTDTTRSRPDLDQALAAEVGLLRARIKEGMVVARAKGTMRGNQLKLSTK